MSAKIHGVKGMPDLLPAELKYWQLIEHKIRGLAAAYGYQELRTPLLENTSLFKRSIGDDTDIIGKEMYSFTAQSGDELSLRPEGTASCVRACIEHSLLRNGQAQKLWYMGPMYRYERPQKGRQRQFHQFGIEAYNIAGPHIDVEQLVIMHELWARLGVQDSITLEINSLGTKDERQAYKQSLVEYFSKHSTELDSDSQRRLTTNPLRILDSKNPELQELIAAAPSILEHISAQSRAELEQVSNLLQELGIKHLINNRLVRGLDYYNGLVYEWVSSKLGSQSAVCAGGRYDSLVAQLHGPESHAVGFALGIERLVLLLQATKVTIPELRIAYLYCDANDERSMAAFAKLSVYTALIQRQLAGRYQVQIQYKPSSENKAYQKASKQNAELMLVISEEEDSKQPMVQINWLSKTITDNAQSEAEWIPLDKLEKIF